MASTLTTKNIEAGYENPSWLGYGYLGERQTAGEGQPERVAEADAVLLKIANEAGWSAQDLFLWLNSKNGRWFGDLAFGSDDDIEAQARKWNLLDLAGLKPTTHIGRIR